MLSLIQIRKIKFFETMGEVQEGGGIGGACNPRLKNRVLSDLLRVFWGDPKTKFIRM